MPKNVNNKDIKLRTLTVRWQCRWWQKAPDSGELSGECMMLEALWKSMRKD
jgi:hypothetical protein